MAINKGVTIHIDAETVALLQKIQRQIIASSPMLNAETLSIPLLARTAIKAWATEHDDGTHTDGGIDNTRSHGGWTGDAKDPKAAIIATRKAKE